MKKFQKISHLLCFVFLTLFSFSFVACSGISVYGAKTDTKNITLKYLGCEETSVTVGGESVPCATNTYDVFYTGSGTLPTSISCKPVIYAEGKAWNTFKYYDSKKKKFTVDEGSISSLSGASWNDYNNFATADNITVSNGSSSFSYSIILQAEGSSSTDLHYYKIVWTFHKIEKKQK